jgi:hypothetical protein
MMLRLLNASLFRNLNGQSSSVRLLAPAGSAGQPQATSRSGSVQAVGPARIPIGGLLRKLLWLPFVALAGALLLTGWLPGLFLVVVLLLPALAPFLRVVLGVLMSTAKGEV